MAEYIKREAAIEMFQWCAYDDWNQGAGTSWAEAFSESAEMIRAIPAADVVEVKRGKWITKKDLQSGMEYTICSACETEIQWRDRHGVLLRVDMQDTPYCPYCGADMRVNDHE